MHVMEITSGTVLCGAAKHCQLLAMELARRGHRVTVVCRPDSWIAQAMRGGPIEVVHSEQTRVPFHELRRVAAIARDSGVDVLHTHMSRAHFFGALLRWWAGLPCVATAHCRKFQLHWMLNDRVIAASEATRRFQTRWNLVRPSRIETIHNFLERRQIELPPPGLRDEVRRELGIEPSWHVVGTVGNVCARKGQLYLVQAFSRVLAVAPEARLAIVGPVLEPKYHDQVRETAERLGVAPRVLWLGQRLDAARLMTAFDQFVLASLEETLPLALLEAMGAGLPIVATDVGGVNECIVAGQSGVLVPPRDAEALGRALAELASDEQRRSNLAAAGRRRAVEQFSADAAVAKIERALASVVRHVAAAPY